MVEAQDLLKLLVPKTDFRGLLRIIKAPPESASLTDRLLAQHFFSQQGDTLPPRKVRISVPRETKVEFSRIQEEHSVRTGKSLAEKIFSHFLEVLPDGYWLLEPGQLREWAAPYRLKDATPEGASFVLGEQHFALLQDIGSLGFSQGETVSLAVNLWTDELRRRVHELGERATRLTARMNELMETVEDLKEEFMEDMNGLDVLCDVAREIVAASAHRAKIAEPEASLMSAAESNPAWYRGAFVGLGEIPGEDDDSFGGDKPRLADEEGGMGAQGSRDDRFLAFLLDRITPKAARDAVSRCLRVEKVLRIQLDLELDGSKAATERVVNLVRARSGEFGIQGDERNGIRSLVSAVKSFAAFVAGGGGERSPASEGGD